MAILDITRPQLFTAADGREAVGVLGRVDQVVGLLQGLTHQIGQNVHHAVQIALCGVDAGADGRRAQIQLEQLVAAAQNAHGAAAQRVGVGLELLTGEHGHRVLELGAAQLDDMGVFLGLALQRRDEPVQRLQQLAGQPDGRQLARGGEHVVGGLSHVHMVVGMHERIIAFFTAQKLDGAVGNYLVGVHIGGSARAPLDGIDDELVMQLPGDQIVTGAFYRIRYAPGQHTGHAVGSRACLLDPCHALDHGPGQTLVGDRKILRGPQRMNPVVRLLVDLFFAYQIVLRSIHGRIIAPSLSLACFQYSNLVYYFQIPILQINL